MCTCHVRPPFAATLLTNYDRTYKNHQHDVNRSNIRRIFYTDRQVSVCQQLWSCMPTDHSTTHEMKPSCFRKWNRFKTANYFFMKQNDQLRCYAKMNTPLNKLVACCWNYISHDDDAPPGNIILPMPPRRRSRQTILHRVPSLDKSLSQLKLDISNE